MSTQAEYSDGDNLYGMDLDNVVESQAKNGVLIGWTLSQNATPNMSVDVAAGSGFAGETYASTGSTTNVIITDAHATLDRLDIIVVNSSGTISAIAGVAATAPNPPDLPDDNICLAIIEVGAAVTAIYNANIISRRLLLGSIQEEHIGDGEVKQAKIADGAINNAKVAADAAIIASKLATIPYSKLNLGDSIVNADIKSDAAIAWPKIAVNANIVYKNQAETITGGWTFSTATTEFTSILQMNDGNMIKFYDDASVYKGRMLAYNSELRLITLPDDLIRIALVSGTSTVIRAGSTENIKFQVGGNDKILIESGTTKTHGLKGLSDCTYSLGIGNAYFALYVGTVYDNQCSIYPEPKNAFEVLSLLKEILPQGAPKGKIDSKNYPAPLRGWDKTKQKPFVHLRSLSQTMDYVIFAMGDIREVLDQLDQRIRQLEVSHAT